jgi:hypothetical protein
VLINRLTSLLRPGARVVSLASAGHRYADVELDDPNFERTPYEPTREGVRPYALDPARAAALWAASEGWVRERF